MARQMIAGSVYPSFRRTTRRFPMAPDRQASTGSATMDASQPMAPDTSTTYRATSHGSAPVGNGSHRGDGDTATLLAGRSIRVRRTASTDGPARNAPTAPAGVRWWRVPGTAAIAGRQTTTACTSGSIPSGASSRRTASRADGSRRRTTGSVVLALHGWVDVFGVDPLPWTPYALDNQSPKVLRNNLRQPTVRTGPPLAPAPSASPFLACRADSRTCARSVSPAHASAPARSPAASSRW